MRVLWTGYLCARHDFSPRPLSVKTHPTVTTCKANTGKTPRFLRFTEPCDKCDVGQLVMTCRPAVMASPGPSPHTGGSGRLDDPITWTVGASTDRGSVRDASRICSGLSSNRRSVVSASSEGRPVFSARLRCRADERCAPSIRRYAGRLGPDARVPEHGPWICGQSA